MQKTLRLRPGRIFASLLAVLVASGIYVMAVSGVASAAANKSVAVQGFGNVHCPEGNTVEAGIQLEAGKFKGEVEGQALVASDGTYKAIDITSGTINQNSFTLQGIVFDDECGGVGEQTNVNATISGQCGTDVLVTYTDANGETGSFLSNVACT